MTRRWRRGAWLGTAFGAAATAVFAAGTAAGSLPFPPFVAFDVVSRLLPGRVLTFAIDGIVSAIRTLDLGSTASTAKLAEQSMAVAVALVVLTLAGMAIGAAARRGRAVAAALGASLVLGGAVTAGAAWLERTAGSATWTAGLWFIAVFTAWALAVEASARALARADARADATGVGVDLGMPGDRDRDARTPGDGDLERRRVLLVVGGVAAAATGGGAAVAWLARGGPAAPPASSGEWWSATHALPNAGASVQPVPGTRPEFTNVPDHYRIDINTMAPSVDAAAWRLRVEGLVDRPMTLSLPALRGQYAPVHQFITLACISNPIPGDLIGTTRWTGVRVGDVLADALPRPAATHLRIRAADGFDEYVSLEEVRDDPRIVFAYEWDGRPLTAEHGFPLRLYLPDRFGMKQPKWIRSIELIDHWEAGYWVRRGWDARAEMRARSIVDVVATDLARGTASGPAVVPIGGIAHAGARGISRVAVRVDAGPWEDAELRQPLSPLTWVVWRREAALSPGRHRIAVRCWDGSGTPQIAADSPPHPSGATGIHTVEASVRAAASTE